jgi:hypothetical protein
MSSKIDAVMISIDGQGKFRKFALYAFLCANEGINFIAYNLAFLELMPAYLCNWRGGPVTPFSCKPSDFCNNPTMIYYVDYS